MLLGMIDLTIIILYIAYWYNNIKYIIILYIAYYTIILNINNFIIDDSIYNNSVHCILVQ